MIKKRFILSALLGIFLCVGSIAFAMTAQEREFKGATSSSYSPTSRHSGYMNREQLNQALFKANTPEELEEVLRQGANINATYLYEGNGGTF